VSYKKAIGIFEALPEAEKYLARYYYTNAHGHHCAIGALIEAPIEAGNVAIFDLLNPMDSKHFSGAVAAQIEDLQMTPTEACMLQNFVDNRYGPAEGRPLFDAALQFMKDRCADY